MNTQESQIAPEGAVLKTEREISKATGGAISVRRLQQLRQRGGGPPLLKIGRRVLYDWADVSEWLHCQKRYSTPDLMQCPDRPNSQASHPVSTPGSGRPCSLNRDRLATMQLEHRIRQ